MKVSFRNSRTFVLTIFILIVILVLQSCSEEQGTTTTGPVDKQYGSLDGVINISNTNVPLEGVIVTIAGLSSTTNSNGEYSFNNIEVGTYNLSASRSGYLDFLQSVQMKQGANTFTFTLVPSLASFVNGKVKNGLGNPMMNLNVSVGSRSDITDAEGNYSIEGVAPGLATIQVFSVEYYDDYSQQFQMPTSGARTINITLISTVLPQVSWIDLTKHSTSMSVNWNGINAPTLIGYNLYRQDATLAGPLSGCLAAYGDWNKINSILITESSYEDYSVNRYNYYYNYYVVPINIDNIETQKDGTTPTKEIDSTIPNFIDLGSWWVPPDDNIHGPFDIPFDGDAIRFWILWDYGGGRCTPLDADWSIHLSTNQTNWITLGRIIWDGSSAMCRMYNLDQYRGSSVYWKVTGNIGEACVDHSTYKLRILKFVDN